MNLDDYRSIKAAGDVITVFIYSQRWLSLTRMKQTLTPRPVWIDSRASFTA